MGETGFAIRVTRSESLDRSHKAEIAVAIALGLLGAEALPTAVLADNVVWQSGPDVHIGSKAVLSAIKPDDLIAVRIDEAVWYGKAAAASGLLETDDGPRLFCHMIKFTNASARKVASIVSFEHRTRVSA